MDNLASILAPIWDTWRAATCMPDHCFCEAVRESWIRQPANTWSSLAFVVAGLWMLGQRQAGRVQTYRLGFVLATLAIGLGSAFYHASLSFVGQFWDVLGMYFLSGLMLLYRVYRGRAFISYLLLMVALALALWFVPELRRGLFGLVLLAAIGLELGYVRTSKPNIQMGWFWGGLALFGLAFAVWILDNARVVCAPQSGLQGHALWHLLGAVAAGFFVSPYDSGG